MAMDPGELHDALALSAKIQAYRNAGADMDTPCRTVLLIAAASPAHAAAELPL